MGDEGRRCSKRVERTMDRLVRNGPVSRRVGDRSCVVSWSTYCSRLLVVSFALLLAGCGSSSARLLDGTSTTSRTPSTAAKALHVLAGTRSPIAKVSPQRAITPPVTAPAPLTPPPVAQGALPQTDALPSSTTPQFHAEMAALWNGVVSGAIAPALPSFFPEPAYLQIKSIGNPAGDYRNRLLAHFALDLAAAHALLGPNPSAARLLGVNLPEASAGWIPPEACYNKVGYWHVANARMVYAVGAQVRSFAIKGIISWRGVWYVIHLGGEARGTAGGLVDLPQVGPGTPGPPGGC